MRRATYIVGALLLLASLGVLMHTYISPEQANRILAFVIFGVAALAIVATLLVVLAFIAPTHTAPTAYGQEVVDNDPVPTAHSAPPPLPPPFPGRQP